MAAESEQTIDIPNDDKTILNDKDNVHKSMVILVTNRKWFKNIITTDGGTLSYFGMMIMIN